MEPDPPSCESGVSFPPAEVPWGVWHAGAVLMAFILLQVGSAYVLPGGPEGVRIVQQMVAGYVATLFLMYLLVRIRAGGGGRTEAVLGLRVGAPLGALRRCLKLLLVGGLGMAGWIFLEGQVMRQLDWHPPPQPIVTWLQEWISTGRYVEAGACSVVAITLVPLTEELIFRGLLYLPARRELGPVGAAMLVSAMFALVHAYPPGLARLFLLAMFFTWLLERARTLWAAVIAHGAYNALVVAVLWVVTAAGVTDSPMTP